MRVIFEWIWNSSGLGCFSIILILVGILFFLAGREFLKAYREKRDS